MVNDGCFQDSGAVMSRQKITTFLWFDDKAEDAANFYVSLFADSKIKRRVPGPMGSVMLVEFELAGSSFIALNGGPHFQFNEAISLSVDCRDQAEVDELWQKFSAGGSPGQCGWLKDKYGLSWQIVPAWLPDILSSGEPEKIGRVMAALRQMTKLDIAALQSAYQG